MTAVYTAQNPNVITAEQLAAIRASLVVVKDGRSWTLRDAEGNILKTSGKKAAIDLFKENYTPEFTVIAHPSAAPQPQPQEQEMIPSTVEPTTQDQPLVEAEVTIEATATTLEQPPQDAPQDAAEQPQDATEQPATEPTPEDERKAARSAKLREAMARVLAAPYVPEDTHPSLKTKKGLHVRFAGDEEVTENQPAVLYHRRMDSFSEKSLIDGVTFMGEPVGAARTRGTWRGVKTTFLWIEAPRLAFPADLVGASSKEMVTFHILVDNDRWDDLEGAEVTATFNDEQPTTGKAPWDAKAGPGDDEQDEDHPDDGGEDDVAPTDKPAPARRVKKDKPQAAAAE